MYQDDLLNDLGYGVSWGAEVEFYLRRTSDNQPPQANEVKSFSITLKERTGLLLQREQGLGQYEVALPISLTANTAGVEAYAKDIIKCRDTLTDIAKEFGLTIDFSPKPLRDDCGSALHIHFNLYDKQTGRNLYASGQYKENHYLMGSVYGLLAKLEAEHEILLTGNDRQRLLAADQQSMRTTPAGLCWGGNNRTTAVRIPDSRPEYRRAELRVPSADHCPHKVLKFILEAIKAGLAAERELVTRALEHRYPRIYGNAFDSQYSFLRFTQLLTGETTPEDQ